MKGCNNFKLRVKAMTLRYVPYSLDSGSGLRGGEGREPCGARPRSVAGIGAQHFQGFSKRAERGVQIQAVSLSRTPPCYAPPLSFKVQDGELTAFQWVADLSHQKQNDRGCSQSSSLSLSLAISLTHTPPHRTPQVQGTGCGGYPIVIIILPLAVVAFEAFRARALVPAINHSKVDGFVPPRQRVNLQIIREPT